MAFKQPAGAAQAAPDPAAWSSIKADDKILIEQARHAYVPCLQTWFGAALNSIIQQCSLCTIHNIGGSGRGAEESVGVRVRLSLLHWLWEVL